MNTRWIAALCLTVTTLTFSTKSMSMNIVDLAYHDASNELVFTVMYRGSHPHQAFGIAWQECRRTSDGNADVLGLVHSSDPDDTAQKDFKTTVRIGLAHFPCDRPATVSIGVPYHKYRETVEIPAAE